MFTALLCNLYFLFLHRPMQHPKDHKFFSKSWFLSQYEHKFCKNNWRKMKLVRRMVYTFLSFLYGVLFYLPFFLFMRRIFIFFITFFMCNIYPFSFSHLFGVYDNFSLFSKIFYYFHKFIFLHIDPRPFYLFDIVFPIQSLSIYLFSNFPFLFVQYIFLSC